MSPVFGFIPPFLARKGDGGMVERAVEHQRCTDRAGVLRQSPLSATQAVRADVTGGLPALANIHCRDWPHRRIVRGQKFVVRGAATFSGRGNEKKRPTLEFLIGEQPRVR